MLKQLTDKIYYMPHNNDTDRPTLGLICGSQYSLIVDSGNSPKHAKEFMTALLDMDIPPVKYLIITHWHWDHILGIKEMNLTTIAHHHTKSKLEEMNQLKWDDSSLDHYVKEGRFSEFTVNCIKKEIPDRDHLTIGHLDITYVDRLEIDLGDLICVVESIGGDHTDDASVIYIPDEKVLFLGDCIYGSSCHGAYGYTEEKLIPMLNKIQEYDAKHYIISHEELYTSETLETFSNELRIANEVVGKKTSVEEALQTFKDTYDRSPSEDEAFYIRCFADVNKARLSD